MSCCGERCRVCQRVVWRNTPNVLKLKMGKSDVWKPDKKPFLEENHQWVNSKTLEELYFISATVACGQLQQSGAYPNNEDLNEVYLVTFFPR